MREGNRILKQTRCYLAGVNSVAKWTRMNMRDMPAGIPADPTAEYIYICAFLDLLAARRNKAT